MYNVHVRIQKLYRIPSFKHPDTTQSLTMQNDKLSYRKAIYTYINTFHTLFLTYVIIYPKLIMKI